MIVSSINSLQPRLARPVRALVSTTLVILALSACSGGPLDPAGTHHQIKMPEKQLPDFLLSNCQDIRHTERWQRQAAYSENPLYWLRLIECARHAEGQQPQEQTAVQQPTNWQDRLRREIFQANGKMTLEQRQQALANINQLAGDIPVALWSLFQLWRDQQASHLALAQANARYRNLRQTSDNELDSLRQQLQDARHRLAETSRKLESLTDIERQLSTRKTVEGFSPPAGQTPPAGDETRGQKTPSRQESKP